MFCDGFFIIKHSFLKFLDIIMKVRETSNSDLSASASQVLLESLLLCFAFLFLYFTLFLHFLFY